MSGSGVPEGWQELEHMYVDGEWVMAYATPDGETVDADGSHLHMSEFTPQQYLQTVEIGGERFHERFDHEGWTSVWYDDDNVPTSFVDVASIDLLQRPGTIYVDEGEIYRSFPTSDGVDVFFDADGNEAAIDPLSHRDVPTFVGFAEVGGHRAVVGIDGDGDRQLYSVQGDRVERPVPWDQIDVIEPGPLQGEPIAIGDYAMPDGPIERVYLFPNGSQATRNADGTYERVIVPTDAEYPDGPAFFEGAFPAGIDHAHAGPIEVFSFADGQTAMRVDGELVLMDTSLQTTHPGEAPVNAGPYPGGELFVFPDGHQLVLRHDGTWAPGMFPDIPPFEELVALRDEVTDDDLSDHLHDDITTLEDVPAPGVVGDDAAADDSDSNELEPPTVEPLEPMFSNNTPIVDPFPDIEVPEPVGDSSYDSTDDATNDPVDELGLTE